MRLRAQSVHGGDVHIFGLEEQPARCQRAAADGCIVSVAISIAARSHINPALTQPGAKTRRAATHAIGVSFLPGPPAGVRWLHDPRAGLLLDPTLHYCASRRYCPTPLLACQRDPLRPGDLFDRRR